MTSVLDPTTADRRHGLIVIPLGAEVPDGYGVLLELDRSGHTRLAWDPSNETETELARAHYQGLREKGYLATRRTGPREGETMPEWDATAREVTMQPGPVGG
jgi:hypothetical protein